MPIFWYSLTMNQYKVGFQSQDKETSKSELKIEGQIPQWLTGTLFRNGPAKFEAGDQKLNHWFDGFSMLHAFRFKNGQISYQSKFLNSHAYGKSKANGRLQYREFATDPCKSIFAKVFTDFQNSLTDNANVNISRYAKDYVALTETTLPVIFDPQTLEAAGVYDFKDKIKGQVTTAHPHYNARTGEFFNYVVKFSAKSVYRIYKGNSEAKRELLCEIPVKNPSYMHSFGLSENYIILTQFPLVINPLKLIFSGKPFIENYQWRPELGTVVTLINRSSGEVDANIKTESFFAFHHINSYEKDGEVIVDLCAYSNPDVIRALYLNNLTGENPSEFPMPHLHRLSLNLKQNLCSSKKISNVGIELPRINYQNFNTRPYKFAYGAAFSNSDSFINQLVKADVTSGQNIVWRRQGTFPGNLYLWQSPVLPTKMKA